MREVALVPQEDSTHVALLVVRTGSGDRLLATRQVQSINGGIRSAASSTEWAAFSGSEGMLLMDRDLLDQQIIDVHGRKVVRVNDVEPATANARRRRHAVLRSARSMSARAEPSAGS